MKKQTGITLIALVITIIVLLILAGVSLATLTGENGVVTRAQRAVERNTEGEEREKIILAMESYTIDKITSEDYSDLPEIMKQEEWCEDAKYNSYTGITTVTVKDSGHKYNILPDGTVNLKTETGDEIIFEVIEYIEGKDTLICVYTNDETVAYKYKEEVLYDITQSGYTYQGESYSKVYGIIVQEDVAIDQLKKVNADTVTVQTVVYKGADLNEDNVVNIADANCAYQLASRGATYYGDMIIAFLADVTKDKVVDSADGNRVRDVINGVVDE